MAKQKRSQKEIARAWTLQHRGVVKEIARQAKVGVSYVSMILNGERIGVARHDSARSRVISALRNAGAPGTY